MSGGSRSVAAFRRRRYGPSPMLVALPGFSFPNSEAKNRSVSLIYGFQSRRGPMTLFGWGLQKERAAQQAPMDMAIGDLFDPAAMLRDLDQLVPQYLDSVDRHELIYPACTRKLTDVHGDVRSIWQHTRLEAMRYVVAIPGRDTELLIGPARQPEMMSALLRQQPHENTVFDFTGVATENLGIAIIAGFNWLNHCAFKAGVPPDKFVRTLTNFRRSFVSHRSGGIRKAPARDARRCWPRGKNRR